MRKTKRLGFVFCGLIAVVMFLAFAVAGMFTATIQNRVSADESEFTWTDPNGNEIEFTYNGEIFYARFMSEDVNDPAVDLIFPKTEALGHGITSYTIEGCYDLVKSVFIPNDNITVSWLNRGFGFETNMYDALNSEEKAEMPYISAEDEIAVCKDVYIGGSLVSFSVEDACGNSDGTETDGYQAPFFGCFYNPWTGDDGWIPGHFITNDVLYDAGCRIHVPNNDVLESLPECYSLYKDANLIVSENMTVAEFNAEYGQDVQAPTTGVVLNTSIATITIATLCALILVYKKREQY